MSARKKLKLRFVPEGIDLIDRDGSFLAGFTEEDMIELLALLKRNQKRIMRRIVK